MSTEILGFLCQSNKTKGCIGDIVSCCSWCLLSFLFFMLFSLMCCCRCAVFVVALIVVLLLLLFFLLFASWCYVVFAVFQCCWEVIVVVFVVFDNCYAVLPIFFFPIAILCWLFVIFHFFHLYLLNFTWWEMFSMILFNYGKFF